jgi:hypothetical protein
MRVTGRSFWCGEIHADPDDLWQLPDRDVLAARLAARGRETSTQIAGRLEQTVQAALGCLYPVKASRWIW